MVYPYPAEVCPIPRCLAGVSHARPLKLTIVVDAIDETDTHLSVVVGYKDYVKDVLTVGVQVPKLPVHCLQSLDGRGGSSSLDPQELAGIGSQGWGGRWERRGEVRGQSLCEISGHGLSPPSPCHCDYCSGLPHWRREWRLKPSPCSAHQDGSLPGVGLHEPRVRGGLFPQWLCP